MNIKEIRSQYPQYNDLSDQQLADSFREKFYSDMPANEFYKKIGLGPLGPAIPQPVTPKGGLTGKESTGIQRTVEDIGRSFTEGATLGGLGEAAAGLQSGMSKVGLGAPITYEQALQLEEERQDQIPLETAIPGQIAGGLATTIGTGGLGLLTKGTKATIPRLAGVGATEGAIAGGLSTPGGLQERAVGAGAGGVLGGILGAAIPAGVRGAQAVGRQVFRGPPKQQAERQLIQALEQTGLGPERLARRVETFGPQGTLADVAEPLTRLARGAAVQSPAASARAQAAFGIRSNLGSIPRIQKLVRGTISGDDFAKTTDEIITRRAAAARPLYEEAFQHGEVKSQAALSLVDHDIIKNTLKGPVVEKIKGNPRVMTAIRNAKSFRKELADLPNNDLEVLDQAYKNIGGLANEARRGGDKVKAGLWDDLRIELKEAITREVPAYGKALKAFSDESTLKDALDFGRTFMKGDIDITSKAVKAMGDAEREMFTIGASREVMDLVEKAANPGAAIRNLLGNRAKMNKMRLLFPDMKTFNGFRKALVNEARFVQTKNTVTGGSPTAEKLADARRQGMAAQVAGDVVQGTSTATAAGRALARLLNREPSPKVAEALGPMLFGGNQAQNAELIRRLLQQQAQRVPRGLGATGATVGGLAAGIPMTAGGLFGRR